MTEAHAGSGDLTRSLELLWSGDEPARRGPRPGLSLAQIVAAAIDVADREGLAALSMRRVATELGVGTMSLYRYVPGKGELLDLMLDEVGGIGDDPEAFRELSWREAMERFAWGLWELLHRHPWLIGVNQARPILGPKALTGLEFVIGLLRELELTDQEKMALIMAIDHYVTGTARTFLLQAQAAEESGVSDEEFWAAQYPLLESAMCSGRFPNLAAMSEDSYAIDGPTALAFGLTPLLDGLAAIVETRRGRRPTS